MKQHPPGTEIDIFKQDPNDWQCQNMWNGCKKLRQLCTSSEADTLPEAEAHQRSRASQSAIPLLLEAATITSWTPSWLLGELGFFIGTSIAQVDLGMEALAVRAHAVVEALAVRAHASVEAGCGGRKKGPGCDWKGALRRGLRRKRGCVFLVFVQALFWGLTCPETTCLGFRCRT